MIIIKDYEKPRNCYDCPGFSKQHYYCRFNSKIDFDLYALDPIPATCPMIDIEPQQLRCSEWIQSHVTKEYKEFICTHCAHAFARKFYYCPNCGQFMINGEKNG